MALAIRSSRLAVTRAQRPARVSRGSVAVYAFKVTLKTPSGEQTIECGADTYILVSAQSRIQWPCPFVSTVACTLTVAALVYLVEVKIKTHQVVFDRWSFGFDPHAAYVLPFPGRC